MPKIWHKTIAAHRDAVRDATLDAAAALVAQHGLTGVTMSQIAQHSGIGRATLYKYFPDLESVLAAWHERHIEEHLRRLDAAAQAAAPADRLDAVLNAYAAICREHRDPTDFAAFLHQGERIMAAQKRLHELVESLVREAAEGGRVREDVPPAELATFTLHALSAASSLPSAAAVDRLVAVTASGLRR